MVDTMVIVQIIGCAGHPAVVRILHISPRIRPITPTIILILVTLIHTFSSCTVLEYFVMRLWVPVILYVLTARPGLH
jgi:antibiotic biosynthesis monooxygenase (ABM) superfamily enzyme